MSNVVADLATDKKCLKSKFTEEFEQYLHKQCLKTTFNGLELDNISWAKKIINLR